MHHIAGYDRSQTLLLPESLDEYVDPENPVRFIEAFVDGLDLKLRGSPAENHIMGRDFSAKSTICATHSFRGTWCDQKE
jgi:hypothetical protein